MYHSEYLLLALVALVQGSPVPAPQAVTSNVSPSAAAPSGCMLNYPGSFGIALMNITASSSSAATSGASVSAQGSAVATGSSEAGSGTTSAYIASQIGDGQPQAPTSASVISQIHDGQIQGPTSAAAVITQIHDGQIQGPTSAPPPPPPTTMQPVTQIHDGQIQAPTEITVTLKSTTIQTETVISQIGDHQPQAPTSGVVHTSVMTSVTVMPANETPSLASRVAQPQSSDSDSAPESQAVACNSTAAVELTLKNGVLLDSQGRTGYIASNYQFQFDKPAQAGAIYTSGWTVCSNGSLALGGSAVFYECLSGNFYNLYDRHWAAQCKPVTISTVKLQDC